ncbi:prephenate dehydrogenase [Candidatus Parvarchaeota archaeon]|nr:prephenate dehydrogenase [Candidatus Parvarchaeota archaeon]
MAKKLEVGIIGFGAFGRLVSLHLQKFAKITAYDSSALLKAKAKSPGVVFSSLEAAASRKIVIFAVPISAFENCARNAAKHVSPGALVLDTCSVKQLPAAAMERLLPKSCFIMGTHPLFGPQSARGGLGGLGIVLCPIRCTGMQLKKAKRVLKSLGLKVSVCTPEEHDRKIARTQAMMHFMLKGWAGVLKNHVKEGQGEFATSSFRQLCKAHSLIANDSTALFTDMQKFNRFAKLERKKLISGLIALDRRLRK